jgi:hypothetical protein
MFVNVSVGVPLCEISRPISSSVHSSESSWPMIGSLMLTIPPGAITTSQSKNAAPPPARYNQ